MDSGSFRRLGGYLRTRWASPRQIRFWLLALVLVYTLLGFFGVPWLVQYLAVNTASKDFGRELRIESVRANPYTLTLQLDGVELADTDNRQLLSWERLFIDLAWSSVLNRAWTFQTIRLDKPVILEERLASGETRLSRLAAGRSANAPAKDEPVPLPAMWVDVLRIEGGVLRFADNLPNVTAAEAEKPVQVSLALQDIGLAIENFSLQHGTRFPVRLDGQIAAGGRLAFDGRLQLLPTPALEGSVRIDKLALLQAEPYLRQFVNVRLDSGTLSLGGQMQTDAKQPFAFQGSASIDALNLSEGANADTLIGWQSLQTELLDLRLNERQLKTSPILVDGLSGRVTIYQDQTTNFSKLRTQLPAEAKAKVDDAVAGPDEAATPFSIIIEGVELTDGILLFADHSLPLPFSTRIHMLNGQLSTLSSGSAQPTRLELEGQVAKYGMARVEGTVQAWHPTRSTKLQLTFRNLQIPEYSPYTVDFAGRKIAGGTMDLDLDYTIRDKQLDGQNNLVLHNLKLGEKMASSNAMDLPLDLAIALLEDNDGVIDLDLPVTGEVGNPEFNFNKVIRQALGNVIKSVITAPFRFLANLIGDDSEELGQVEFLPGRTDLLPPQRERIAKLSEALKQRPALSLELAGPFSRTFDGPALQRDKAIAALRQRLTERGNDVAAPSLTAETNQGMLETLFTTYYPQAELEAAQARFTEKQNASADKTGIDALAYRNHLAERIIDAQAVTDADLKAIANTRASAVRNVLIDPTADTSIETDRVRLLDPKALAAVDSKHIAMQLAITSD